MDVQSQVLHKTSHDQSHVLSQLLGSIVNDSIEVVDMTQVLNEDTPVIQLPEPFKNTGGFQFKQLSKYDETGPVCYWNDFVAGEHCGTHFDAPNHWVTGRENASVDKIPVKNLIGEARVINIKEKCIENPDYCLTVEDIEEYEAEFGQIPKHSWVLLYTGWAEYLNSEKYFNTDRDGLSHTPGFTPEASRFLVERDILGVGVETVGTDAGIAHTFDPPFPSHHIMHQANKYGLAQLTNVDKLPPKGAVLIAAPLKIENGSGSPIRAIALV
ncbi:MULTISPECIES: cyclase family protein [Sporosarcina]|uniref:Kynurenine formamidase n=2 Tax=Sporosarcina newyorkensis TaxID=759851 RepID=A0A1T4XNN9_9BACL|nr:MULTISPECIES: cyclase family protein [Sporosarcina]EGQ22498.1 cyclase [Sporosarcina newyorkensis 2681]MBY0222463.1 cyclase family protein [Sporosarcina aquimarina]SKA91147.1 Kynurenine formamidase [Sporosarcina newyorkensis]